LLEFLEDKTQTFITTSKETLVEQFAERAIVFRVENGAATVQTRENG
jgi:recombinational DNA repair ATPase RecF